MTLVELHQLLAPLVEHLSKRMKTPWDWGEQLQVEQLQLTRVEEQSMEELSQWILCLQSPELLNPGQLTSGWEASLCLTSDCPV